MAATSDHDAGGAKPARSRRGTSSSERNSARQSDRSLKWAIDRLDERERRFSFAASGAAVIFGIVVYVVESSSHAHRQKGQLSPETILVIGLVGGALLLGATFLGRRAPVGFVALFVGLFLSSTIILALPFLVLGFWILYRSYKIQREASAEARAARAEAKAGARSGPTRTRGESKTGRATAAPTKGRSGSPAKPAANKRYTPKRPPPPAPKPSRRERKAAQASE